jgi:hypothetical protein
VAQVLSQFFDALVGTVCSDCWITSIHVDVDRDGVNFIITPDSKVRPINAQECLIRSEFVNESLVEIAKWEEFSHIVICAKVG